MDCSDADVSNRLWIFLLVCREEILMRSNRVIVVIALTGIVLGICQSHAGANPLVALTKAGIGLYRVLSKIPAPIQAVIGYGAGKLADPYVDRAMGRESIEDIRKQLGSIESDNDEHRMILQELRLGLNETMTAGEVENAIENALLRVDHKLYDLSQKVKEQQRMIETHESLINELNEDVTTVARNQAKLDIRQETLEQKFEELRRTYPKYTPRQQAAVLGVGAMSYLIAGDNDEAYRGFRFANAIDPTDAGYIYGLAVIHHRKGAIEESEKLLAAAVVVERRHSLTRSVWWRNVSERFQGPDRAWIEQARRDPVYGVYTPGLLRVPIGPLVNR